MSFYHQILQDFIQNLNDYNHKEQNFASRWELLKQYGELDLLRKQVKDNLWLDELAHWDASISKLQFVQDDFLCKIRKQLQNASSAKERALLLPELCFQADYNIKAGRSYYQTEALDVLFQSLLQMKEEDYIGLETMPDNLVHHEISPAGLILELIQHPHFLKGGVLYDIGCGTGFVSLMLALFGNQDLRIRAVDLQKILCSTGKKLLKNTELIALSSYLSLFSTQQPPMLTIFIYSLLFMGRLWISFSTLCEFRQQDGPLVLPHLGKVLVHSQRWIF